MSTTNRNEKIMENFNQPWDTALYNEKHAFVYEFGKEIVQLLNPKPGEKILDLGCGSGQLTNEIAKSGALVAGMDHSEEMVRDAKNRYPEIAFETMDATNFSLDAPVDAIFSNAVLHWIKDKSAMASCVYKSLKKGGRFVAEFGGQYCINNVKNAVKNQLIKNGFEENASKEVWYFHSTGEFSTLLEKEGFLVKSIWHIDRPTTLEDPIDGMKDWITMFCNNFFIGLDERVKETIINNAVEDLRATNFKDGKWVVDYTRLRFLAIK